MCDEKKDLCELKDEVITALDLDSWKHSWHLPKKGEDWWSLDTFMEVRSVLDQKMVDANNRLTFLGLLTYDKIDWSYPVERLRDEVMALDAAIIEGDVGVGETMDELIAEAREQREKLQIAERWLEDISNEKICSKDE